MNTNVLLFLSQLTTATPYSLYPYIVTLKDVKILGLFIMDNRKEIYSWVFKKFQGEIEPLEIIREEYEFIKPSTDFFIYNTNKGIYLLVVSDYLDNSDILELVSEIQREFEIELNSKPVDTLDGHAIHTDNNIIANKYMLFEVL